ncbi:Elg1p NDAI_0C01340 [Naumovozyma dairenensis CBS 421]|uniref:ATPase AAA-type core domain-containing protein n=1 Tax=Naumovozyma dairenensis (strain ATCC 10597 / BCRC 20456 / CBS 421 / NBRC 0211 / NRRL Y-12639) TaxID=1071378 RepID=G0W7N4_NAUDC|nr:hypothetical protein NDAI_0C01340 [Naumovozyma dairenensis CBS 421]CCD23795.1 hypothetical protein NDAI_0C01340 [Naumovozyma dairenensis CBS 421]
MMKRSNPLTALLNGNNRKKVKLNTSSIENKSMCPSEIENPVQNIDEHPSSSELDIPFEDLSSSPLKLTEQQNCNLFSVSHISPIKEKLKNQSVQNFLMNRPTEKKEPIIISIDDGDEEETAIHHNANAYKDTSATYVDDDMIITSSNTILNDLSKNVKKVKLKDLFSNFKKSNNDADGADTEGALKRKNPISKLKEIDPPIRYRQSIEPEGTDYINHGDVTLPLHEKRCTVDHNINITQQYTWTEQDYKTIRDVVDDTPTISTTYTFEYKKKLSSNWPEFFKPKSVNEVMLEPALKTAFKEWIEKSFELLKKVTSRKKLQNIIEKDENSEFANFIIHDNDEDEEDINDSNVVDFVPLAILHGYAVGKNTLVEVIMRDLDCQIFEVNSSENRSRKDILDKLSEFATTHYVKGHGSKGVILFDDVDVLFKEHDKLFWQAVEKTLLTSRRPIVLICRDLNFIPTNLIEVAEEENSLFEVKKISNKTCLMFVKRYCQTLKLTLDEDILSMTVERNKGDIRKCLVDLQFNFSSSGEFNCPKDNMNSFHGSLIDFSFNSELSSINNILEANTEYKSSINQGTDKTLLTKNNEEVFNSNPDEEFRRKHDYMVDYRYHLQDSIQGALLPYELSIANYMKEMLDRRYGDLKLSKVFDNNAYKFPKMTKNSLAFLSGRVNPRKIQFETTLRKTRNSRRIREILDRFDDNHNVDEYDNTAEFDFFKTNKRHIQTDLNAYVLELAKGEAYRKEKNLELFSRVSKEYPEESEDNIVRQLGQDGLLKPVRFKSNPQTVIKSWNL